MSNTGSQDAREFIPRRSFGNCRWCGAKDVRLQYLMCERCLRVAERVPSKVQVLLGRPEVKKRLPEGPVTVKNIVPELREFVLDPKRRFPPDRSSLEHWDTMLKQAADLVTTPDLRTRVNELAKQGAEIPSEAELRKIIGLDKLLYFILKAAVLSGTLTLAAGEDEKGFCVVCWKATPTEKHMLCSDCRSELIREFQEEENTPEEAPKVPRGMATSDIILRDRKR